MSFLSLDIVPIIDDNLIWGIYFHFVIYVLLTSYLFIKIKRPIQGFVLLVMTYLRLEYHVYSGPGKKIIVNFPK